MPATVMILVLLAALLHASWNFLVKQAEDKYLSMSAVVIGHTPFAAAALLYAPLPGIDSLAYILTGAALHTGYQLFLLNSYRFGDLSQVYPLARGVAPLIVACISVILLGVRLSVLELSGIVVIGAGIASLCAVRRRDGVHSHRAGFLAITTGTFIAAYSLVDGIGARKAGTALGFYGWLSLCNAVVFGTIMNFSRPGLIRKMVNRNWRLVLTAGGASFCAYALVTWGFTLAPIALVTALRETSIIFALLFGAIFLREGFDTLKVWATVLTMLGVVALRIGG